MEIWQKPLKIKVNPQADLSNPPRSRTERKGRLARARTQDSPPTDTPELRGHVGAGGPPRTMCAGRPVRFRPGDGVEAPVRSLAQPGPASRKDSETSLCSPFWTLPQSVFSQTRDWTREEEVPVRTGQLCAWRGQAEPAGPRGCPQCLQPVRGHRGLAVWEGSGRCVFNSSKDTAARDGVTSGQQHYVVAPTRTPHRCQACAGGGPGGGSGLCFRETAEGEGPPWGQAALALDTKPTGQLLGGRGGKSLLLAVGHGPTRGQLPASVPLTTPWPRASARAQGPRSGPPGPAAALRVLGDHSLSAGRGDVSRGPIPLAHSPTERRTPGGPGGEVTALGGASGMPHWPRTERAPPGRTRPREAAPPARPTPSLLSSHRPEGSRTT